MLDGLESPKDLAEDAARDVVRGDFAEHDRGREDHHEGPAHPDRERETGHLGGEGEQARRSLAHGGAFDRKGRILFAAILLVAAALRLYRLDHFSYGLDEVMQAFWLRGDWEFFWEGRRTDAAHGPLDYLVGHLVERLGPREWERKLPAVLWGLGTIGALYALLRRRAGTRVALLAALLLSVAPFHVRFSQELRPYSLGLFLMCMSLLALDRYLERPDWRRLALLFAACLATAYALYGAALVLAIAAGALLVEDALTAEGQRRRTARRFLALSPLFAAAVAAAFFPWLSVPFGAFGSARAVLSEPLVLERLGRSFSFFGFAPADGHPLGWTGLLFVGLVSAGLVLAPRTPRLRFLAAWAVVGAVSIEALEQLRPHYYNTRHFLPAGLALVALVALALVELWRTPRRRRLAVALLACVLLLDARGLAGYFREGRADWRPLARFLRARPAGEPIFTGTQYSQLCVAFYAAGPDWLFRGGRGDRLISSLDLDARRLTWSWQPGTTGWLVLSWDSSDTDFEKWARMFPGVPFPTAEGAVLRRLDPALWDRMRQTAR